MALIVPTKETGRHYHVMAGMQGTWPFVDLAYDGANEAIDVFMRISGEFAGDRISPEKRLEAEAALYGTMETVIEHGVFVDTPPFRVVIMDCKDCNSALLN